MNPYYSFANAFSKLVNDGKALPLGGFAPEGKAQPQPGPGAPLAMIFSPHPDDECIVGALALRLGREAGMRILNVAVTQGSNKARQQGRLVELANACRYLGWGVEQTAPNGLEKITPKARQTEPQHWAAAVKVIAASLAKNQPRIVFLPHEGDWNGTHIGTHYLVMDALKTLPTSFECVLVETEFWAALSTPNLMVESSVEDVSELLAALSFHVEEVKRNPYHLRLPPWMQDNVRRGAELVGGQGGVAPDYMFATLYRARRWRNGQVQDLYTGGRQVSMKDSPANALA
jgi:N-acetylglucosamine malate deacetylase 1